MAQIHAPNESLLEADKNHHKLCDVEINGPLYVRLTKFFTAFTQHAPANVDFVFRPVPNNEFKTANLRTQSSVSSFPGF